MRCCGEIPVLVDRVAIARMPRISRVNPKKYGCAVKPFKSIYQTASKRKGGPEALEKLLPEVHDQFLLSGRSDAWFLSAMTKRVFQAGFIWRVIEAKWPGFEEAFFQFDPARLMALDEAEWDAYGRDERIVRNLQKVYALRHNVYYVNEISAQYGGYGHFLEQWPLSDLVGLMVHLKKSGKRLGGMTGGFFLATVGKDCYFLTRDVIGCLRHEGLDIPDQPTGQKHLKAIQEAFNQWHDESGRSYRHLSAIAAFSYGENRRGHDEA